MADKVPTHKVPALRALAFRLSGLPLAARVRALRDTPFGFFLDEDRLWQLAGCSVVRDFRADEVIESALFYVVLQVSPLLACVIFPPAPPTRPLSASIATRKPPSHRCPPRRCTESYRARCKYAALRLL